MYRLNRYFSWMITHHRRDFAVRLRYTNSTASCAAANH
jgi:hypothetical protein